LLEGIQPVTPVLPVGISPQELSQSLEASPLAWSDTFAQRDCGVTGAGWQEFVSAPVDNWLDFSLNPVQPAEASYQLFNFSTPDFDLNPVMPVSVSSPALVGLFDDSFASSTPSAPEALPTPKPSVSPVAAPTPVATASSPESSSTKRGKKRSLTPDAGEEVVERRQRNTEAARRYRQRRLDRLSELEEALEAMRAERDDLKIKLARQEAQNEALKSIMGGLKG
jgi:hypothetical protein